MVIKTIELNGEQITEAFAPMSVTMTLEDEIDNSRGDMIVRENNVPEVGQDLDILVTWMNASPLHPRTKVIIKHTTNECMAMVKELKYKVDINTLHRIIFFYLADYLSINIVPQNIKSDEITSELLVITKILKKINKKLAIEISEIFVKEDFKQFLPLAHQLREAGAIIGLDDYGATEIDIFELEFFPLDFVKLDRSYSINEKHLDSRFHKKMIKIAKDRGLMLIAEGVENKTLNILRSFGYKFVQGYIFHKPEKFIS